MAALRVREDRVRRNVFDKLAKNKRLCIDETYGCNDWRADVINDDYQTELLEVVACEEWLWVICLGKALSLLPRPSSFDTSQ